MATVDPTAAAHSIERQFRLYQSSRDEANLDILRAVAVLAVLVHHCMQMWMPDFLPQLGRTGVLIFFVHTSLVLMMSLERLRSHGAYFRRFYVQRAFRIYPLAVVSVLIVIALRIPYSHLEQYAAPSLKRVVANLLLVQNLSASRESVWNTSILGPLWSLPFEVQMYLLLPVIFWALCRWPAKSTGVLLLCAAVFVAGAEWRYSSDAGICRFFPCFIAGVISYRMRAFVRPVFRWIWWPLAVVAGVVGFAALPSREPWSAWVLCVALGCVIPMFHPARCHWLQRGSHLIAKYSYGIYLAHLPLLWFCFRWCHASVISQTALFAALVVLVPVALYHAIEKPCIGFGKQLTARSFPGTPLSISAARATNG